MHKREAMKHVHSTLSITPNNAAVDKQRHSSRVCFLFCATVCHTHAHISEWRHVHKLLF